MLRIEGSIVALVTPFNADGSVNMAKLGELVEFHIKNHTDALCILGTTGEASTMEFAEEEEVVRYVVGLAKGRIKIIVGSGSNCTATAV